MTVLSSRLVRTTALILPALAAAAPAAWAGGFGIREQSAYYQGTSFAGNAAGGEGLGSMYWNPAALSFTRGLTVEGNASYVAPHATIDVYSATTPLGVGSLGTNGVSDIVDNAVVPSAYINYAWDRWAVGLAVNSPFGLVTNAPCDWSGRFYGCKSSIFDLNVTGNIAYRVTDWLTLGAGVQVNYINAELDQAQIIPPGVEGYSKVKGDDTALGFTLGALITLAPGTTIGIGYRSAVEQNLSGTVDISYMGHLLAGMYAGADLKLPDQATLSLRSQIDPRWTVMGSVEWTNWSTVQQLVVVPASGSPSVLDLQWRDGWFFSGGAEYKWDDRLALRAGIAYEMTPVDGLRTPRLPDTDRFWLSGGFTYAFTQQLSMDFAYTHIFGQNGEIDLSNTDPANTLRGNLVGEVTNGYVDIISVGLRYKFDAPTQTALITK